MAEFVAFNPCGLEFSARISRNNLEFAIEANSPLFLIGCFTHAAH